MKQFSTSCLAELVSIERLLSSRPTEETTRGPGGLRSHLSPPSGPSSTWLTSLLHQGADTTMTTELGQTSLHLAASEGLRACTEVLVHAGGGAHLYARDHQGHTPLDLARIAGHKDTARYLKECMWKQDKQTDMQRRRSVLKLRQDLIHQARLNDHREKEVRRGLVEENFTEWTTRKGLQTLHLETPSQGPPSRYHRHCTLMEPGQPEPQPGPEPQLQPEPQPERNKRKRWVGRGPQEPWNISTNPTRPPHSSLCGPQTVRMGSRPESPAPGAEPDLRSSVVLSRAGDGTPLYTTRWSRGVAAPAPDLPTGVLERLLFPGDFPSRMDRPAQSVLEPPGLGRRRPQAGHSASPWTEVAMHLAEVLEPGHY